MTEIYIRDNRIPWDSDGNCHRRTNNEINEILTGIIADPPKSIKEGRLGVTFDYPNENAVNKFLDADIINKLKDLMLTPSLYFNTQ